MHQLIVEPAFGSKLSGLTGQTVVCDSEGRALGFFSPLLDRPAVKDLQLEPPWSIEQSKEMRKERTGKLLSEILKRLGIE